MANFSLQQFPSRSVSIKDLIDFLLACSRIGRLHGEFHH